jgi:EEF1A lysine methyltransferase 2
VGNFDEFGDVGEIWFGNAVERNMVLWIEQNINDKNARIAEFGCGNGHLLVLLVWVVIYITYWKAKKRFLNLTGFDYSKNSIELSEKVAKSEGVEIIYRQVDLCANEVQVERNSWDLIYDKGTFDAVSLCPNDGEMHERNLEMENLYAKCCFEALKPGGKLMICSCNWTVEELQTKFKQQGFSFITTVQVSKQSFSFGGKAGDTARCTIFQKPF